MDSEDDDYQLQLALALSMAGDDLDPSQFEQTPTTQTAEAGAHAVAPAAAPASQGAATPSTDLAAALAAAFQAIAGQAPANAYAAAQQQQDPAPPPAFPFPQQQQQQPRQQPAPAAARPAPPAARKLPPWAQQLSSWWQPGPIGYPPAAANSSADAKQLVQQQQVELAVGEMPAALKVMSVMLQQPLSCPAAGAAGGAGALMLTCVVPSGSSKGTVTSAYLDTLISSWLSRAAAAARSSSHLQLLHAAFQRTPDPANITESGARGLVLLLGLRLAARAMKILENDEDDLFFETGRTTQELLASLRSSTHPLSSTFLSAMLCCSTTSSAAACWSRILDSVIKGFGSYKLTGGVTDLEPLMVGLDRVTQDPILLRQLADALAQEVLTLPPAGAPQQVHHAAAAAQAEGGSILSALLNVSSAPNALTVLQAMHKQAFFSTGAAGTTSYTSGKVSAAAAAMSPATGLFTCLRSYPNNIGEIDGAKRLLQGIMERVAEAMHQVAKRLAALKAPDVGGGAGREVLLSWLSAVAAVNEVRCKGGEYSALRFLWGAPDGFMLNLTAAVLRLTKPFTSGYLTQNPKFQDLFSKHLNPSYYTTHAHRLGSASSEATLSGQRGVPSGSSRKVPPRPAAPAAVAAAAGSSADGLVMAADPVAAAAAASFITEVFFICQRYFHVGLMPAVHRFQKLYQHLWDTYSDSVAKAAAANTSSSPNRSPPAELTLFHNCYTAQLLQPDMTADAVQFAVLEIVWLPDLLQTSSSGGSGDGSSSSGVLSCVPESMLSEAASWLTFVIQQGQAEQLAAVPIGLLMSSLVTLLEHRNEVNSLLVVAKLVQLLLVMLAPQVNLERRTRGALGRSNLSAGEMALVASVLGTSVTQQQLVPALMRVYGQADFVVGLDVDVDNYDKFGMRHQIDQILEELWRDERCKACIKQQAVAAAAGGGGSTGPFAAFISAVLNDLIYLFKDSLERLADIKQIEDSKAHTKAWQSMQDSAKEDKENFYRGQQRTAAGFMSMAKTTLELLTTITADADIARSFMAQPLLSRTAYAVLHFLELLVGPRCQTLDVKNPQRYNFDKHQLLLSMVQLAGQLARCPEFAQALADEPDFEASTLQTAIDLLNASHSYAAADSLSAVLHSISNSPGHLNKKLRMSDTSPVGGAPADGSNTDGVEAAAGGAVGAAAGGGDREAETQALVARWIAGVGAGPTSYEAAEQPYKELLEPLSVGVFESTASGAYNSQFATMAAQPEGDNSQKLRRLGRELRDLRGKTRLPVQAAAACFVRQDGDRPDKVRCIISGPQDTPYEGGLFVFDVYFPPGYPNVPPLMVLETTGDGRARFNPNLYADGKVCLSLLGTWHGGDDSSKWNPSTSSLFQILLSIQGMIFVEDPYFNEPQVELMRGTTEGNITSVRYNVDLRLQTLRYAVLNMIRKPPPGLEDVVTNHFRVLRGVLASRAGRWLHDAAVCDPSGTTFKRLVDVMNGITEALAAL